MILRLFRDLLDGLRAGWDVLWWGQAYPRTLPVRWLQRERAAMADAGVEWMEGRLSSADYFAMARRSSRRR